MAKELHPLFLKMEELVKEQNELKFNEFCEQNKDFLMKQNPLAFISYQVDFYALQDNFFKTLEVVNHYKNAPYISMEVEDFLNELKQKLESYKEPEEKKYSLEDIEKALKTNNENTIAAALSYLNKQNIRLYLPVVENFLKDENVIYKYKTLAIFILIQQKIDKEIEVYKDGLIYTIAPSLLELPFDTYEYELCKGEIEKADIESNIKQVAIEIMNTVQIKEFPDSMIDMENLDLMKDIFIEVSKSYSQTVKSSVEERERIFKLSKKHSIPSKEIEALIAQINEIMVK